MKTTTEFNPSNYPQIKFMTVSEILKKYPELKEQEGELMKIANGLNNDSPAKAHNPTDND